jgi:hypothetical protein
MMVALSTLNILPDEMRSKGYAKPRRRWYMSALGSIVLPKAVGVNLNFAGAANIV